jgi:hypothetical protein
VVHRTVSVTERICIDIVTAIGVHEDAETLHTDAAEDAEDVALVLVELGRCLAAEGEEVVAEEGLDAREREMGKTRAVVQECMNTLLLLVRCTVLREEKLTPNERLVQ